jgi:thioester reductase-like protein
MALSLRPAEASPAWLLALVSECLGVPARDLDVHAPLTRYGLDSIASVELTAAIAAALDRELPDSLLFDYPDIASLARALRDPDPRPAAFSAGIAQMQADAVLPPDVRPQPGTPADAPRAVLLTGATGFVGSYLLRALLRETDADVHCLVRGGRADRGARLRQTLETYGIWDPAVAARIRLLDGDLGRPDLGLPRAAFEALAHRVDAVYHAAAAVDWVHSYAALRGVNVRGTLDLLRIACSDRPKPFHFVSSLAVCHSTWGPRQVTEADSVLPYLGGLHLGYAQSKCVAEALVGAAGARGLPVSIYRPALVSGDSRSGVSNPEDFLSRLTRACVRSGCAPDLDFVLDCCPVDYVADAIVRLARTPADAPRVFHLANPGTHHWRAYVLWLNLFGYPVRLLPYRDWLRRFEAESTAPDHPLHPLRAFFLSPPAGEGGLTLPELYEQGRTSRVRHERTDAVLAGLAVACPRLGPALLERYVANFIARGALPTAGRARARRGPEPAAAFDARFFTSVLRRFSGDETLRVEDVAPLPPASEHSILTELTAWHSRRTAGLFPYRLRIDSRHVALADPSWVMVKVKPPDEAVLGVGGALAELCDPALGRAWRRFGARLGLRGGGCREAGVYGQTDARFRRHAPTAYGVQPGDDRRPWILVLELLSDVELMNTAADVSGWGGDHVEAALRGIADVHAIWYGREVELTGRPWLGHVQSARDMAEMTELWTALAERAGGGFGAWIGSEIRGVQRALIADLGRWWPALEAMPRTLIHNDFNPRNVALRRTPAGFRLCAYDWELATLGVPQHDLAEFLCFVLPPDVGRETVARYLEAHRAALASATGQPIDRDGWALGFRLSLYDLLLNRLALYAVVHRFRPEPFLERVIRTWWALYRLFPYAGPPAGPATPEVTP